MNYDIQCYILKHGSSIATNVSDTFPGTYLLKSTDTVSYGKPKNIVTESYAEEDGLRVYTPSAVKREAVDVTLRFCFLDTESDGDRYDQYDAFAEFVSGCEFTWWDTVRMRKQSLVLLDKTDPEEHFSGNIPYLEADFKFKNVSGKPSAANHWTWLWRHTQYACARVDGMNTGYARYYILQFHRTSDNTMKGYQLIRAFEYNNTAFTTITTTQLRDMSEEDYLYRLECFNGYVLSEMEGTYSDFKGNVKNIMDGAYVKDTNTCPLS